MSLFTIYLQFIQPNNKLFPVKQNQYNPNIQNSNYKAKYIKYPMQRDLDYKYKSLKYKQKYLQLKNKF